MVRDRQHSYRRGPGYLEQQPDSAEGGKKTVVEQYWEVEGPVPPGQEPAPYRVELVGVYVRPEVAVRRAIIRRLLTGRGVPVRDQLRSHALFARNFEAFACCFDTVRVEGGFAKVGAGWGGIPSDIQRTPNHNRWSCTTTTGGRTARAGASAGAAAAWGAMWPSWTRA